MVTQADSTLAAIKNRVRELTASSDESQLTDSDLERRINDFYSGNFPYAIKLDQTRVVYEIFTKPNIDRYPVDINRYQGFRAPVYFEGVQGSFYKERSAFFGLWPRFPQLSQIGAGDGVTVNFSFTVSPIPFLSKNVVIGTTAAGQSVRIEDNGSGTLQLVTTDSVGNNSFTSVGAIDYVTGVGSITFPVAPDSTAPIQCWTSSYSAARPWSCMFWNNEITIRPVPDGVYKVEIEVYQTPVQFLLTTDNPIIKQWWLYIAYGVSMELLRCRQDKDGVENLREGFELQERLVLERQAVEEIGQANATIYNTGIYPIYNAGCW